MALRLLVWPLSSDGKPLQPKKPGWVVGWQLVDGSIVVCAGIIQERVDTNSIIGKWETTVSRRSSSVPCFVPTSSGPWWAVEPLGTQQQQLLLYQPGIFYRHETPCSGGIFAKILWRLNEANRLMERLKLGDDTPVEHREQNKLMGATNDRTKEEFKLKDTLKDNELSKRLWRLVAMHFVLTRHCKNANGCLFQIPAVQLFLLLRKSRPHQDEVNSYILCFNRALSLTLNCMLGVLAALLLFYKTNAILTLLEQAWRICYDESLRDNIQWLETFPAGFKLNVPLTQNMGREITMLIGVHDSIFGWTLLVKTWILRVMGILSMIFGFTTLVAASHDILILTTAHIAIVATSFRVMHRTQLYLLASLWRLFRGRKKNVLRHRTDTMEYDSMQLLLGMLLFTAALFLFTTILVYYAFFTVLHLGVQIMGAALWSLYVTVRFLPLGKCVLRATHPGWFSERVFLEENVALSKSRTVTRLVPVPQSYFFILSDPLVTYFSAVLSAIPTFAVEVITGKPCTIQEAFLSAEPPNWKYM